MKIVIVAEWFSEKMGYVENYLPPAFGKLGHDVHLVTSDMQVYGTDEELYNKVYQKHLGDRLVPTGVFAKDGYTLHRAPHSLEGGLHITNLEQTLAHIRPDLVYCFEINSKDTQTIADIKHKYNYKLVCESRIHLSVFAVPKTFAQKLSQLKRWAIGRWLSRKIDLFYPIAPDVQYVITKYYGIPVSKCKLTSLGVETDLFSPKLTDAEISAYRLKLGFDSSDIVCLYTGRFTHAKGPLVLAQAINYLHSQGHTKFKALFVGQGADDYIAEMRQNNNCFFHSFVNGQELVNFYCALDIGVWPLQESTSQLDAAACGMPIIISDKVEDLFRIDTNGLSYRQGNFNDLAEKILQLEDAGKRKEMGNRGIAKIQKHYSWEALAINKLADFNKLL